METTGVYEASLLVLHTQHAIFLQHEPEKI